MPAAAPSAAPPPSPTRRRRRPPRALHAVVDAPRLPDRALRGLINCGNSCFINVVLQALLACHPFRRFLLQCKAMHLPDRPDTLLAKFVRLADEMTLRLTSGGGPAPNGVAQPEGKLPALPPQPPNTRKGGAARARKENGALAEDPLLPEFFYDVFPGSMGAVAGPGLITAGGSQEDAEEFLSFVLNGLHEELVEMDKGADADEGGMEAAQNGRISPVTANGVGNGGYGGVEEEDAITGVWEEMTRKGKTVEIRGGDFEQSGITDIFGGALRSEVKRGRAKPSVTREPFFRLSLDIESGMIRDVEHALTAYFEPERLEGYTVERVRGGGHETVEARKQVLLHTRPQVLILHLKRFSHNSVTGALNKVSRQMPFPEVLEVPGQVVYGGGQRRVYDLTAVVTHIGKELAGGHYTCDVRWKGQYGGWVTCDDSKVWATGVNKVLRKQAYLLFYSLRDQGAVRA